MFMIPQRGDINLLPGKALDVQLCWSSTYYYWRTFKTFWYELRLFNIHVIQKYVQFNTIKRKRRPSCIDWDKVTKSSFYILAKQGQKQRDEAEQQLCKDARPVEPALQRPLLAAAGRQQPHHLLLRSLPRPYLIFVIFSTRAKFLENEIYTEKRQFFALNL